MLISYNIDEIINSHNKENKQFLYILILSEYF